MTSGAWPMSSRLLSRHTAAATEDRHAQLLTHPERGERAHALPQNIATKTSENATQETALLTVYTSEQGNGGVWAVRPRSPGRSGDATRMGCAGGIPLSMPFILAFCPEASHASSAVAGCGIPRT